jgi:FeS assembly SUF system protein
MENTSIKDLIVQALKTIFDPEIPVDIYELGLIYEINIDEKNHVEVVMTLTSPSCPVAGTLPQEVEQKVKGVDGVSDVTLELVFEPPWSQEMMSEEAQLELGLL